MFGGKKPSHGKGPSPPELAFGLHVKHLSFD